MLIQIADYIQNSVTARSQQRIAVLTILISLVLLPLPFTPYVDEPPLIYLMSALALTLSGISWLASLQAVRSLEETNEDA